MNTSAGIIDSLEHEQPISEISGLIRTIYKFEEKKDKNGKSFTTQAFVLSDETTNATCMVRCFDRREIPLECVGQKITLKCNANSRGVTKNIFTPTTGANAGKTSHSVKVTKEADISIGESATAPQSTTDGNRSSRPSPSSQLTEIGNLYLECLFEADRVNQNSPIRIDDVQALATTLFIEANRKGIRFAATPKANPTPSPAAEVRPQSEPVQETKPEPQNEQPSATPSAADKVMSPLELASFSTRNSGSAQLRKLVESSTDEVISEAVDLLLKDFTQSSDATLPQMDAAWAEWEKLHKLPNAAMLMDLKAFCVIVDKHKPVEPVVEDQIIEDDDISIEID